MCVSFMIRRVRLTSPSFDLDPPQSNQSGPSLWADRDLEWTLHFPADVRPLGYAWDLTKPQTMFNLYTVYIYTHIYVYIFWSTDLVLLNGQWWSHWSSPWDAVAWGTAAALVQVDHLEESVVHKFAHVVKRKQYRHTVRHIQYTVITLQSFI